MNNFNNATVPFEDSLKVKNKFQYGAQKSLNHQEIINADYHLLMFKKDELNGLTKETDNNNNVNKDNEDHNVPSTPIATRTLDNLFSPILNDTIRFASGRPKRYLLQNNQKFDKNDPNVRSFKGTLFEFLGK